MSLLYESSNILVVEQETFIIIGKTENIRVANALSRGIMNVSPMLVSFDKKIDPSKNYLLLKMENSVWRDGSSNTAMPSRELNKSQKKYDILEVEQIPEKIKRIKEIFEIRKKGLELLDQNCMRYTSRLFNFFGDHLFYSSILKEIEKSNPKSNYYSDGILDWAHISNTTPNSAYQQLKLEYDSISISMIKMHALWSKYVERINSMSNEDQIIQLVNQDFELEIFLGGEIY